MRSFARFSSNRKLCVQIQMQQQFQICCNCSWNKLSILTLKCSFIVNWSKKLKCDGTGITEKANEISGREWCSDYKTCDWLTCTSCSIHGKWETTHCAFLWCLACSKGYLYKLMKYFMPRNGSTKYSDYKNNLIWIIGEKKLTKISKKKKFKSIKPCIGVSIYSAVYVAIVHLQYMYAIWLQLPKLSLII